MHSDAAVNIIRHNGTMCCVCCKDERLCVDCICISTPQFDIQLLQSILIYTCASIPGRTYQLLPPLQHAPPHSRWTMQPPWAPCTSLHAPTALYSQSCSDTGQVIADSSLQWVATRRNVQCMYTVCCIRQQAMGEASVCGLPVAVVACRLSYNTGASALPL